LKVEFRASDSSGRTGAVFGAATASANGEFTYRNALPSNYRVTLANLPAGYYMKEMELANIDIRTQPLTLIRTPESGVRIILAKGGALQGTVADASQQPVADQQVVLIPDDFRNRADLYKTARTDATGRFSILGMAPGTYKAYAWQAIEPFRYFDEDFVRRFDDRAVSVRITESSSSTANLSLIP